MQTHIYTVEELMLDDSFVSWCLNNNDANVSSHWQTIIRDNPLQAEVFNEAKELIKLLRGGLSKNEVSRQIEKVRQELQQRKTAPADNNPLHYSPSLSSTLIVTGNGKIKRKVFRLITVSAAAACLFFLIIWGFSGVKTSDDLLTKKFTPAMNFQSELGKRHHVTLPDGSEVILNSNSSISLDKDFNKSRREVKLTGDAFFKVAKNLSKPFVVFADNISTVALGTEFYVHDKPDNRESIKIELLKGKVKVETMKKTGLQKNIILIPGESAETTDGINLQKKTFDQAYLRNWINGTISFEKKPVLDALRELETWYAVKIQVNEDGLKNRRISGTYNNASIQDLLKVICFSINRQFYVSGNTFIIE